MWYNAYNLLNPTTPLVNPGAGQIESYNELQPRFGMTYTVDPRTVLRASYGRYAQAPNSAFEQYNFLQQNDTARARARSVCSVCRPRPGHPVRPEVSNNYDFSFEHQFTRRHVGEADAVPAQDAGPNSAVLPRSEDQLRLRTERRSPDVARARARGRQGRLLAQRSRGAARRSRTRTATSTTPSWTTVGRSSTVQHEHRAVQRLHQSRRRRRRATRRPAWPIPRARPVRSRTRTTTRRSSR